MGHPASVSRACHFFIAAVTGGAEFGQMLQKNGVFVVDEQADDVDVTAVVFGGKLDAGDDLHISISGIGDGRGQTVNGIVVGQGKGCQLFL